MAYSPYYAPYYRPMNYYNASVPQEQPMQTQPVQQQAMPMMQAPMPSNDMIWVLNESEATAYPVAPNNSVVLWDKSNPVIYIKSVNMQGVPSMRVLYFTERTEETQKMPENAQKEHKCTCGDKFVTKEQFEDLKGDLERLTAKVEEMSTPILEKPKTTKKAKESEE